jgi:ABC-type multidrug transport system permease subunit
MRFVWLSAWKDFARFRRDPMSLAIPLAIPLILGVLLNVVFGRGGEASPQGRLLIDDEDQTFMSNVLTGAFSRDPLSKMILEERVSRETGRNRIDRGDASAFLIIPKGLQEAILLDRPFHLELTVNPSQRILPGIIEEAINIMVEGEFYLQKIAGNELIVFNLGGKGTPSDELIAASSLAINHVINNLRKYTDPPLIQLDTVVTRDRTPEKSFAAVFFPSMLFMAALFIANLLSADVWKERTSGTLRRICAVPVDLAAFLGGRVLFIACVLLMVAGVAVFAAHFVAGVPVARPAIAVLWLAFAGTTFYVLLLLLSLQASTQRAANVTANLVIFPLMMLGGSFFPFEAMPPWMARIGGLTPNGWAVMRFKEIVDGSSLPSSFLAGTATLAILTTIGFLLAVRKLRRVVA